MENITVKYEDLKTDEKLERFTKPVITKVQLVKYAGASGDFNPLHTDDATAQKMGMKGVIAHGMLVMGFLGQYVQELAGNAEIKKINMRFGGMTMPGDEITCSATVKKVYEEDGNKYVDLDLQAEKTPSEVVGFGSATLNFG